ncbi:MAG: glycosyltransferase [Bacillus cereus]|jgi:glycosyltransferase involved in cell wall biosynthesis|nr:glycosyltransferase [Bacillus cereus]
MKASIIIPTRNKLPRLKLTLLSLECQDYSKSDYEVIIIDNNSNDGTEDYISNNKFSFDLIYCKHKILGRSSARNKGVEIARYPILIFIDDDLLLSHSFISEHMKAQKSKSSIVHGKIYNMTYLKFFKDPIEGTLYETFCTENTDVKRLKGKSISIDDIVNDFDKIKRNNNKITSFEQLIKDIYEANLHKMFWIGFTGGNVSIPKDWVIDAGLFDTGFGKNWGFEDVELGYRLWKLNYYFNYSNRASNYHMAHYRFHFAQENNETSSYFYTKHKDHKIKLLTEFSEGKLQRKELFDLLGKI